MFFFVLFFYILYKSAPCIFALPVNIIMRPNSKYICAIFDHKYILTINENKFCTNRNDIEYNTEKIIDANDNILDRVNVNIDNVCRVNAPCEQFLQGVKPNQAWSNKPVITKIQVNMLFNNIKLISFLQDAAMSDRTARSIFNLLKFHGTLLRFILEIG